MLSPYKSPILQMRKLRLWDLGGDLPEVGQLGGGGRVPLAVTPSPWPLPRCTLPRSEAGHREEGRTGPVQSQKQ